MKIVPERWGIDQLIDERLRIDPRPQYQRTLVWTKERKQRLIDSILRGYDLPKFYFKTKTTRNGFEFDVADGQQRINAILEFYDGNYSLPGNIEIDGINLSNNSYNNLPARFKSKFDNFELSIASIVESTTKDINELFIRLQGGVSLIPVELRHAMLSNIGKDIFKLTEKSKLFAYENNGSTFISRISNKRYKHQDYIDHIFCLAYYNNSKPDIKAKTLMELYVELMEADKSVYKEPLEKTIEILGLMYTINLSKKGLFKNKWSFVDVFWLLYNEKENFTSIKYDQFAENYLLYENKRKEFQSKSDELIEGDKTTNLIFDKELYDYIQVYSKDGALKGSIKRRYEVLKLKLFNETNFNF